MPLAAARGKAAAASGCSCSGMAAAVGPIMMHWQSFKCSLCALLALFVQEESWREKERRSCEEEERKQDRRREERQTAEQDEEQMRREEEKGYRKRRGTSADWRKRIDCLFLLKSWLRRFGEPESKSKGPGPCWNSSYDHCDEFLWCFL